MAFTRLIAGRYHADVHWWLTFNEAAIFMTVYDSDASPGLSGAAAIRHNIIAAYRRAYEAIHQIDHKAMVSSNLARIGDANLLRNGAERFSERLFIDSVADAGYGCDLVGAPAGALAKGVGHNTVGFRIAAAQHRAVAQFVGIGCEARVSISQYFFEQQ